MIVVEGEVAAQTLRYHGFPAVAIPDAATWSSAWSKALTGVGDVCVALHAGPTGPAWLTRVGPADRVRYLRLEDGVDVNELHRTLPHHFITAWQGLADTEVTLADLTRRKTEEAREAARLACEPLLTQRDVLDAFEATLLRIGFAGPTRLPKLLFLVAISRLCPKPVSFLVKGPSSVGKSFAVERVLDFLPAEAFYEITAMSDKALIYSDEPLRHRILALFESGGLSEVTELIVRSLLSNGRISYDTVIDMEPVHIEREGPTSLITTTTQLGINPENETRMLSDTIVETPEQITGAMMVTAENEDREPVPLDDWHALQRYLALSPEVTIPFTRELARAIPPVSVRLQRDFGALLTLVRAHALLHQQHRGHDDKGQIVATVEDYGAVRELVHVIVAEAAEQKVPPSVRGTADALVAMGSAAEVDGDGVTTSQVASKLQIGRTSASRRLRHAADLGFVVEHSGGKSSRSKRWILGERAADRAQGQDVLPTVAELEQTCTRARTTDRDLRAAQGPAS